ncbi:winged helix-turn-helix transcriptional regulator [Nocardia sp. NPDC051052]|uniref:winged helix-turn-helix transcriptional regulator n=1 Tax=Nocardia sp. NPDC051052 TaxID=3364322 RepID=UPI00379F321B
MSSELAGTGRAAAGPTPRIPDCPLARTAQTIGPWWTLEILHEMFDGHTGFESIGRNLATPADVLLARMAALIAKGLLETEHGSANPRDRNYRLTDLGRSLRPIILAMAAWGNHLLAPQDRSLILVDAATGSEADPVLVDRWTGRKVDSTGYFFARGPKASALISARYPPNPGAASQHSVEIEEQ